MTVEWHVLGDQIKEQTTLAPGGNGLETVYEVPYIIDSGPATGSQHAVRVSPRDFTPANVAQKIAADAATVHGVGSLTHADAQLA
jgi:hypothetical protein